MLALVSSGPGIFMSLLMIFMPETPSFLMKTKGRKAATLSLSRLRTPSLRLEEELDRLITISEKSLTDSPKGFSLDSLMEPEVYRPAAFSLILAFFKQATGISAILFYQKEIFESSKSSIDPNWASIIVSGVRTMGTLLALFIIDRTGRRRLLVSSGLIISISLGGLGLYHYIGYWSQQFAATHGLWPLYALMLFMLGYSMGYGTIPSMMTPEMTPIEARGLISGCTTAVACGMAFLITRFFPLVLANMRQEYIWWLFAGISSSGVFILFAFLPETSQRSFQEINRRCSEGWKNSTLILI